VKVFNFGLRTRIYLSMLAVLVLSLLVIGISTTLFFIEENEEYHRERVSRKANTIIEAIQYFTKEVPIDESLDVVIKDFDDKIQELADINNIDINIYTTKGDIVVSSYLERNENFHKITVPEEIFEQLKIDSTILVPSEIEGKKTIAFYSYAYNINNEKVGIIHLPYSETNEFLEKEIEVFFSTLVKVYLVLLIIGGMIAYFLSNYITRSLRTISDRFKNVQFNAKNEKLEWKSRDEIGLLVNEYNKMIDQLEQSAEQLARTERETAWREMAKQVAHEIKNPLTPMKLSLQHLERTYSPNDPDFKERLERFSKNMIEQIDTLSNIASEFSNFAKMPKAKMEDVNVIDIIRSSTNLFKAETTIRCINDCEEAIIRGDKEQLLRVFSNLIKNSIQAIPNDRNAEITISALTQNNIITIAVIDNGTGIPEEKKDYIFVPNFTTKTTGMGLGLAMVKNIIELHEGTIWFESEPDKGTTFYIQLPLK
jgi:two-component system, NtrC family, nitrogen regulation sensor histidine kinase NtrY